MAPKIRIGSTYDSSRLTLVLTGERRAGRVRLLLVRSCRLWCRGYESPFPEEHAYGTKLLAGNLRLIFGWQCHYRPIEIDNVEILQPWIDVKRKVHKRTVVRQREGIAPNA